MRAFGLVALLLLSGMVFAQDGQAEDELAGTVRARDAQTTVRLPIKGVAKTSIDWERELTVLEQRMVDTSPDAATKRQTEYLLRTVPEPSIHPTVCNYHREHGGKAVESCAQCGVWQKNRPVLFGERNSLGVQLLDTERRIEGYVEMPVERSPAPTSITNNWNFGSVAPLPVIQPMNQLLPGTQQSTTFASIGFVPVTPNKFCFGMSQYVQVITNVYQQQQ